VGDGWSVSPLAGAQVVCEDGRFTLLWRQVRSAVSGLFENGEHILVALLVGELKTGSVFSRISIPSLAAVAVFEEVESILRVLLAAAFARAAKGALGRFCVEHGEKAVDRGTSVTIRAARAFLAALRTSCQQKQVRVSTMRLNEGRFERPGGKGTYICK